MSTNLNVNAYPLRSQSSLSEDNIQDPHPNFPSFPLPPSFLGEIEEFFLNFSEKAQVSEESSYRENLKNRITSPGKRKHPIEEPAALPRKKTKKNSDTLLESPLNTNNTQDLAPWKHDPVIAKLAKKIFNAAQEKNLSPRELANKIKRDTQTIKRWIKNPERLLFKNLYQLKTVAQECAPHLAEEIENLLPHPLYDADSIIELKKRVSLFNPKLAHKISKDFHALSRCINDGIALNAEDQYRLKKMFGDPTQDQTLGINANASSLLESGRKPKHDEVIAALVKKIFKAVEEKKWSWIQFAKKIHKSASFVSRCKANPEKISFKNFYQWKEGVRELNPAFAQEIENLLPHPLYDAKSIEQLKLKTSLHNTVLADKIRAPHSIFVDCQDRGVSIGIEYQYRLKNLFGDPA